MIREDIQSLRAIAIISVVLFHTFPDKFPNGYLGVDIFFVVSGFLMSKILYRSAFTTFSIIEFYYRRAKRICIIYYFVLLTVIVLKQFLQAEIWFNANNSYHLFSLLFVTNQKIIHDRTDYFRLFETDETSRNLFIHCWSLSVEIQFYLIVPFIFLGLRHFKQKSSEILILIGIVIGSFSLNYLSEDRNFMFNFMPARIWQFAIGMIVYICAEYFKELNDVTIPKKSKSSWKLNFDFLAISFLMLIFSPIKMVPDILRLIVSVVTGFVIFQDFGKNNYVFSIKLFSYIGDLSFVIYLIHWPILQFLRGNADNWISLYFIIILSILIHHTIEGTILNQSRRVILVILSILLIANIFAYITFCRSPNTLSEIYPARYEKVIKENKKMLKTAWKWPDCELQPIPEYPNGLLYNFGHCKFKNGNGTQKILLLGNSYALNQAQIIYEAFNGKFSTFEYVSIIANYVLYDNGRDNSDLNLKISQRIAQMIQPDIIFIITRIGPDPMNRIISYDTDRVLNQYQQIASFYERIAKKVYILGTFPKFPLNFMYSFIETLELEWDDLEKFKIPKKIVDRDMMFANERLQRINCQKCKIYDLSQIFLEGDSFTGYDSLNLLSYFDNDIHLTDHGLSKIYPFYVEFVKNITNIL